MKDTERDLRTLFILGLHLLHVKDQGNAHTTKKNKRHIYKTINVKLDFMTCIY